MIPKFVKTTVLTFMLSLSLLAAGAPVINEKASLPEQTRLYTVVADDFWQTNCYIFVGEHNEAIVVDPSDELEASEKELLVDTATGKARPATKDELAKAENGEVTEAATGKKLLVYRMWRGTGKDTARIYEVIQQNKLKVKYIVVTHGHIDHIASIGFLKEKTGAKVLMHAADVRGKDGAKLNFDVAKPPTGYPKDAYTLEGGLPKVDQLVKEGDLITCGGMTFQVLHTPGHSPGHISLIARMKGRLFLVGGDILLYHTVGRTNFRDGSGDEALERKTILEKLYTLPDDTVVLPGHYNYTTIGEEKVNNLFVTVEPTVAPTPPPAETPKN